MMLDQCHTSLVERRLTYVISFSFHEPYVNLFDTI